MHYVISDIHGCYAQFTELLGLIDFKDTDTLYVLGDIVDRGPHPIKVLSALMEMPNAVCIVGNHELMALDGLRFLKEPLINSRSILIIFPYRNFLKIHLCYGDYYTS